ncbi:MAG TPA: heme-binding protein [Terriglobales bacterium]|nr:heme-binding protein [Terriglobales bacterium]
MIQTSKLTLEDALVGIAAGRKRATEIGVPMDIAVVDEGGHILAFERMDGGLIGSIQIAIDKAYTASVLRIPTGEEGKIAQPGGPDFGIHTSCGGRIMIFAGGIPVKFKGTVVGAVGCSSGTVQEDTSVAEAAIAAIEATLRAQSSRL